MTAAIYLIGDDGNLVSMSEQPYESEALLQELLAKYPDVLAGDQPAEPDQQRWLLIRREIGIPAEQDGSDRWSLDHLFIDREGIPTFVEVKRSSDTRIRREVVGQMLDYAANGTHWWPADRLRAEFEAQCEKNDRDPAEVFASFLGSDIETESFWQTVNVNLQAGRIRLVFVADEIPPELRRIIEFLNKQMNPAIVLGVEIKQYLDPSPRALRTLVPRVIGSTPATRIPKTEGRQWDEETFFADLGSRNPRGLEPARAILDWSRRRMPEIVWGRGKKSGSFTPGLTRNGARNQFMGIWTYCQLELQFEYMKARGPFHDDSKRIDLLHRVNTALDLSLSDKEISLRPSIPLEVLADSQKLERFLTVLDYYVGEVERASASDSDEPVLMPEVRSR